MISRNRNKNKPNAFVLLAGAVFFVLFYLVGISASAFGKEEETESNLPPISVRGGDMGEVTRLVIDAMPENYILKPGNNRLDIIFPAFEWSFLKDDLLKVALLKNVAKAEVIYREDGAILSVFYSCNCQGDFYKWKDKKLVLDVYDVNAAGNPLKAKKEEPEKREEAKAEQSEKEKSVEASVKKPEEAKKEETEKQSELTEKKSEKSDEAPGKKTEVMSKADLKTSELQAQLRDLFRKAEEQGAVSFQTDSAKTETNSEKTPLAATRSETTENKEAEAKTESGDGTEAKETSKTPEDLVTKIIQGGVLPAASAESPREKITDNISLSEGGLADENYDPLPGADNVTDFTAPCLPPATFALPEVGTEDSFYEKLSDYRGKLMNEFDKPDPETALKLAQYYVSYGMGDEAIQTLSSFDITDRRGFVVRSMAELLAGRPINTGSVFVTDGKASCEGPHALWKAYYAYKSGHDKQAADFAAKENVLKAFADLPRPLQTEIGTSLALNLVRAGNRAGAQSLVDIIADNVGQFDTGVMLVRGLIDASDGNAYRAIEGLETVMRTSTGPDTQMAGLALSEIKLATDASLREEELSALEEVAFLKSGEIDGARALALIAENYARAGRFDIAFERLQQNTYVEENVRDPVTVKIEALFRRLAVNGEGADNPNNLTVFWKYNEIIPRDPALYFNFAKRLYDLGHDRAVEEIIVYLEKEYPEYVKKQDVSFLAASSYIRLGEYQKAKSVLKDNYPDDTDYALLKAKALALNEEYAKAYETLKDFTGAAAENAKAYYASAGGLWKEAQESYETAYTYENAPDKDEMSRAAGYMAGTRYPGMAEEYKDLYKKVFQHADAQAKDPEKTLQETGSVTAYFRKKGDELLKFLYDGLRFETASIKNKPETVKNDNKNAENKKNG